MKDLGVMLVELDEKVDLNLLDKIDKNTTELMLSAYDELSQNLIELKWSNEEIQKENAELKEIIIKLLREKI